MTAATDVATAIQTVADNLAACCAGPEDAIRLLLRVAAEVPVPADPLGQVAASRCRRACLIQACRQSALYQPTS